MKSLISIILLLAGLGLCFQANAAIDCTGKWEKTIQVQPHDLVMLAIQDMAIGKVAIARADSIPMPGLVKDNCKDFERAIWAYNMRERIRAVNIGYQASNSTGALNPQAVLHRIVYLRNPGIVLRL